MHATWLIVDGYSLLHRFDPAGARRPGGLQVARQKLVRHVEDLAAGRYDRVTIVFDGKESGGGEGYESPHIEVLFSPVGRTADTVIERLVHDAPDPESILVVSSDRLERQTVSGRGAQTVGCGDFLAEGDQRRAHRPASPPGRGGRPTLGDFFPGKE